MSDSYEERHGQEPADDEDSARHCDIKISNLPRALGNGIYRVTFTGMEYQPGARPALRFRYLGPEVRTEPFDFQHVTDEMFEAAEREREKAAAQAENEGWLPERPNVVYSTKTGKLVTDAMIEAWVAEAEAGYDVDELRERVRSGQTTPTEAQAEVIEHTATITTYCERCGQDHDEKSAEALNGSSEIYAERAQGRIAHSHSHAHPADLAAATDLTVHAHPHSHPAHNTGGHDHAHLAGDRPAPFSELREVNTAKLARVIAELMRKGVISYREVGLAMEPGDVTGWNEQAERWLTS
jgi:alkylhydroperoxidase family enzyme